MVRRRPRSALFLAIALPAAVLLNSIAVVSASAASSGLSTARAATTQFQALSRATAAGYALPAAPAPLHECIATPDGTAAMGFHYINGDLLDTTVDPKRPEALVYAPDQHGKLKLAALEYVVFQAPWIAAHGDEMPTLFGQMFMATPSPNRYDIPAFFSLHVWLWQNNPAGLFAPFNPNVTCASAASSGLSTARAATTQFQALSRATAAGYALPAAPAPLHECIATPDGTAAMGFHYINGDLLDTTVDPKRPEALVYAPDQHGKLKLAALEYVVFQAPWIAAHGDEMPTLFGQMFMATPSPNRYDIPAFFSLHVWLWQNNPAGLFAPFNPNVTCGDASASAQGAGQAVSAAAVIGDRASRWTCRTSAPNGLMR